MPARSPTSVRAPVRPFLDALLSGDLDAAREVAAAALALVRTRVAVFSDLIQPAQYEIGELWYSGRIGVADEHRATAIVEKVVRALPPTPSQSPIPPGNRCVLAALGEESHVLGLRLFELALQDDGWSTRSLGGQAALDGVIRAVRLRPVRMVALSAAFLPSPSPLQSAIAAIKATGARVLVGGPVFNRVPDLWLRVGADGHGSDARIGIVVARRLAR